ncbi:MAG: class I SAM-dependent methyltransferase [Pseudomonadota bacterium]
MQQDDWSHGYVIDQPYTEGFYRELSPAWINYVAVLNGCHPRPLEGDFAYLELGCGQGHSTNVLAACFPKARFYGVDFNPAHIANAERIAREAGIANVRFLERSFDELDRADLPEFDFIGLHGIYSWVLPPMQAAICRVIRQRLKPGGFVYVSYNALPGWASEAPNQKLLYEFGQAAIGSSVERVDKALEQAKKLADLGTGHHRLNPAAAKHLASIAKHARAYLVHEYMNASWQPFFSCDVADAMAEAKLSFCGSATLAENYPELTANEAGIALLRAQPTPRLQQLLLDFLVNQRFRRDIFVRGHARLPQAAVLRHLRQCCFLAPRPLQDLTPKAKVPRGEIGFDEASFPALRDLFAGGSLALQDVVARAGGKAKSAGDIERTVQMMAACGYLAPAARPFAAAPMPKTLTRCAAPSPVNRAFLSSGAATVTRRYLASEVHGNGISIEPVEAMALLHLIGANGSAAPGRAQLEDAVHAELKARGITAKVGENRKGKPPADPLREVAKDQVGRLLDRTLSVLVRAGIVTCE